MKDSVELIKELMEKTFGPAGPEGVFRQYYNGDPEVLPLFQLPCLIVSQVSDDTNEGAYGQDDVSDEIRVKVVFNKADDFSHDDVKPIDLTEKKIRDIIAALDESGRYADKSIKGALRRMLNQVVAEAGEPDNALQGITALAPTMRVQYGINQRPTNSDMGNVPLTAEGWVTFPLQYTVNTDD